MSAQRIGLVLEGGALRGLFTAGILDVFMENDLVFDGCVGVSAGAAFGCNIKSRQIGRVLRYNLKYCNDPRYCSVRSLLKTGDLFNADFCYDQLPNVLDPFDAEAYDANPLDFYVVCTDIKDGTPLYQKCNKANKETYTYMRASASMPIVSRPVEINGHKYLDGAIADAIPLQFFIDQGYSRNVVILTQPRDYVKEKVSGGIRFLLPGKPAVTRGMLQRHLQYNESRDLTFKLEAEGSAFVLCPDERLPIDHTTHDPAIIQQTYDLGRVIAERALPDLKIWLDSK